MFSTFFIVIIGLLAITRPSESQRRGGPRVITQPQDFEADAGSSITLPCNIRNVGRRSVFWFKGDDPQGRELIMQIKSVRGRFTVPRQYQEIIDSGKLGTDASNLIINDLHSSDTDAYTCSIAWARQTVTHTLNVHGEPELFLTAVPSDGQVSVGEDLPAALSCVASGDVPATVSWYKEGEADVVMAVGNILNFFESNRDDSGRYVCTADNGISDPISFSFDLTIEYVDVQANVTEIVASGVDSMAQLSCQISGYPEPQVAWYTSVGPVAEDSRHSFFSHDNTHYMKIEQMRPSDLGEYQCYGYNEKARDHATITVLSTPGQITSLQVSPTLDPRSYMAVWEVQSLAPIRFYYFALREGDSDEVNSSSLEGSSTPDDGQSLYRGSNIFDVTPGQTYELMVKAVAEEYQPGPDQEQPYVFTVPAPEPEIADVRPFYPEATYSPEPYGPSGPSEHSSAQENATQDAWKWWKLTMTLISRLPQVARIIQVAQDDA